MTEKQREELRPIIEREALTWSVQFLTPKEIDKYNILKASLMGMHRSLKKLHVDFTLILVDGNRFFQFKDIQHLCVIKGDGKYLSIAAASVLAKTHRDEYMKKLHFQYPHYGWDANKGYPTKRHRQAIVENGICKHHRLTFRMI